MKRINIDNYRFYETPLGLFPSVTGITSFGKKLQQNDSRYGLVGWKDGLRESRETNLQLAHYGFEDIHPVVQESLDKDLSISELISNNSRERGDRLHELIERHLLGRSMPLILPRLEITDLYDLFKPLLKKIQDRILYIEQPTSHPWGFAGTPDCVAMYEGKMTLFDWKNARKPKKRSYIRDYQLQLGAYSKSVEYTHGIEIEQAYICIGVYPDKYLEFTNPGLIVKPELQMFKLTKRQLNSWADKFKLLCDQFKVMIEEKRGF